MPKVLGFVDLDEEPNFVPPSPPSSGLLAKVVGTWNPPFADPVNIDPLPVTNSEVEMANGNIMLQLADGVTTATFQIEQTAPVQLIQIQGLIFDTSLTLEEVLGTQDLLDVAYSIPVPIDVAGVALDPPNTGYQYQAAGKVAGQDTTVVLINVFEAIPNPLEIELSFDPTTKILTANINGADMPVADLSPLDDRIPNGASMFIGVFTPFGEQTGLTVSPVTEV